MCGPLPGTKVRTRARDRGGRWLGDAAHRADRRRSSRSQRGPRGGRVDRAQRSGASLNTATRGKPLRLEPRTCEDAWATGAPAPQRPHADTAGAKAPRRLRRARVGPRFKDPSPRWSEAERGSGRNRQRVRHRHRPRSGLAHIYTYIPLPTHEASLLTSSGGQGRDVWRARARVIANFRAHCKRKPEMLFTE